MLPSTPRFLNILITACLTLIGTHGYTRETPKLAIAWSVPAPAISSLSVSRDSKFVGIVTKDGSVACYAVTGAKIWSASLPGVSDVVVAPGAGYALTYSRINPCDTQVSFVDAKGSVVWSRRLSGAVWSADARALGDCARFVVGTGERYVYVFDIGENRRRHRRWRAPGAVVSINLDSTGERITYGTWQDSVYGCATRSGKSIWKMQSDCRALNYVRTLEGGTRSILRKTPNRARKDGEFALLDSSGKTIWSRAIRHSRKDRVLVSPKGEYTCIGYTKAISHKGTVEKEEHAVLYDSRGKQMWDKGSLFFSARPLLVTQSGMVLVAGADKSLFWLDRAGDPEASLKLPADVVRSASSPDGKRLLIECMDGRLYLINIPLTYSCQLSVVSSGTEN